jgi:hypothetical protein
MHDLKEGTPGGGPYGCGPGHDREEGTPGGGPYGCGPGA